MIPTFPWPFSSLTVPQAGGTYEGKSFGKVLRDLRITMCRRNLVVRRESVCHSVSSSFATVFCPSRPCCRRYGLRVWKFGYPRRSAHAPRSLLSRLKGVPADCPSCSMLRRSILNPESTAFVPSYQSYGSLQRSDRFAIRFDLQVVRKR